MSEKIECEECENWKRRGDELFDQLQNHEEDKQLGLLRESYDRKCDEYKNLILLNARLRLLLDANGVDHDL